jgi:Ring finger domain
MESEQLIDTGGAGMNMAPVDQQGGGSNIDDPYYINVTVLEDNRLSPSLSDNNTNHMDPKNTQMQLNLIGYLLMSSFLLILSIILGLLVYSILRRRHLLAWDTTMDSRSATGTHHGSPSRSMLLRIQRRYETIEHWIITKKVQAHDDFCVKVVTNFGHHQHQATSTAVPTTSPTTEGHDNDNNNKSNHNDTSTETELEETVVEAVNNMEQQQQQQQQQRLCFLNCQPALENDYEQHECPICMSALTRGQIVSWSANDKCSHVYHHQCIKEWLLRHVECCLCKQVFLPVDMKKGPAKEAALQELSCDYAAASATSYYCVQTGLIRIPRSVRCTKTELKLLEQRIFEGTVPPATLASIRGSREASTSRNDDGQLVTTTSVVVAVPMMMTTTTTTATSTTTTTATGFLANHQNSTLTTTTTSSSASTTSSSTTTIPTDDDAAASVYEQGLETSPPSLASVSIDQHVDSVEGLPISATTISHGPEHEQQQQHRPQSGMAHSVSSSASSSSRDVELGGDQELLTASYHLELEKSRIGDNRCCILHDSSDDSVEVKETSSSGHILEEEELSDHHDMVDRFQREGF